MKKILLSTLLFAVLGSVAVAQKKKLAPAKPKTPPVVAKEASYKSLEIGSRIPNEGAMLGGTRPGQMISLGQAKTEKGLVVMFSCNTCPYVIKSQQRTREAMNLAKGLGIGMVVINSNEAKRGEDDSPNAMAAYAVSQGYEVPYLRDDASVMANLFGATRTPEVFFFNGEGMLVYKGAIEDNPAEPEKSKVFYLNNAMNATVANKPVTPAETKSIGCSIKRMNL